MTKIVIQLGKSRADDISIFGHTAAVYGIPTVAMYDMSGSLFLKPEQAEAIAEGLKKAAEDSRK